ncbi:hypothetical protein SOVF_151140 [Spinacia oleracea]|nr:hypothetical protein SOVF_151140 [Spinacia oleracea]
MYSLPENFRIANNAAPVTFPAADSNRHTASSWSNNFPESRRVFIDAGAASSSKMAKLKEVISIHSSAKWREYFQASKKSNKLIVIYFTATWCVPCRAMEPTIKELAANYIDVDWVKIDVDELFNVSCEYGIQTMPTFMFMKNGNVIDKVAGARKEQLQRKIQKYRAH